MIKETLIKLAEAPIEPAGETKDASKFGAQSEGRDLISGSLTKDVIDNENDDSLGYTRLGILLQKTS